MCQSMVDIQSPTENKGNKKEEERKKQDENIYGLPYYIGRPYPKMRSWVYAPDDALIHTVFFPVVFSRKVLADYATTASLIFHFLRSQHRECNLFPIRK